MNDADLIKSRIRDILKNPAFSKPQRDQWQKILQRAHTVEELIWYEEKLQGAIPEFARRKNKEVAKHIKGKY